MGHNADDEGLGGGVGAGCNATTCWRSEDVGRVQEVLGDDAHGAVQLADPPAVDVVLLEQKGTNKQP